MHSSPTPLGHDRGRPAVTVLLSATFLLLTACRIPIVPKELKSEEDVHPTEDVAANTDEIHLRMRSLVDPLSGEIEATADEMISRTDDPAVRRAALEWKAQAVPAIRESLFQPEPLTALFDTWVLANQMHIYFSEGPGKEALGKESTSAAETCLRLEQQMSDVAASITKSGDVSTARDAAREWAAAHPIRTAISHRESTLTRIMERELRSEFTVGEAVGNMAMALDDLNRRVEVYTDQLLRQARWETELIALDISAEYELDQAVPLLRRMAESLARLREFAESLSGSLAEVAGALRTVAPAVERLIATAESAPELIARERVVAVESAQQELTRVIDFVRREEKVALDHVTSERLAALESLHDAVRQERRAFTDDVELIVTNAVDDAFWRAAGLVAATLVVVLGAALVGLGLLRRVVSGLLREVGQPPS